MADTKIKIQPGMVVKARGPVVDYNGDGAPYLHATPAEPYGVILEDDFRPDWFVVSWALRGACNVGLADVEIVSVRDTVYAVGNNAPRPYTPKGKR
jgi:hypothetical protein